jgi:DNA-directed RNA polymerase beta' subunit
MKLNISGLTGISEVYVERENNQKVVLTMGSDMSSIIGNPVYSQIVDINKMTSNDVCEIERLYGIEAARNCFIQEMYGTLASDLNVRHIELLADNMSHLGELLSVNRFGVKRGNNEPLHRASFEETTKQFIDSSLFTEHDPMTGPSANVMFGQFIHSGTNAFSIVLDEDKLAELNPVPNWKKMVVDPFDREAVSNILVKPTTRLLLDNLSLDDIFIFKFDPFLL